MRAKAKINLFLHIIGKRPDNYHLLESFAVFADDIYDELNVNSSNINDISLTVRGNFADQLKQQSSLEENIIFKAAKYLKTQHCQGVTIDLNKNIPVAAGIGGGSADAAAAIKTLCNFWNIKLDEVALKELCLKLGADVPICYNGKPAYMSGIGEIIENISYIPSFFAVVVNPLISLSTKDVFENYHSNYSAELTEKPFSFNDFNSLVEFLTQQRNDLEESAILKAPVISQILTMLALQDGCRISRMSGSGATCFGLFESKEQADKAYKNISTTQPFWWAAVTHLGNPQTVN